MEGGFRDNLLRRAGAALRWRLEGEQALGMPLVLIHGWALALEYWDAVVPHLLPAHPILRYDRRGFGQSQGLYDPRLACDDLIALLDAAGTEEACVVGMSQGARVALHAAARAPARVRALVLDGAPRFEAETELPLARYRALRDEEGIPAMQEAILAHPLMQLRDPAGPLRNLLQQCVSTYRGADLDGGWTTVAPPDLRTIRSPALVLNGAHDGARRHDAAMVLCEAISGARGMQISDAAHLTALDQPARWAQAVHEFAASAGRK